MVPLKKARARQGYFREQRSNNVAKRREGEGGLCEGLHSAAAVLEEE